MMTPIGTPTPTPILAEELRPDDDDAAVAVTVAVATDVVEDWETGMDTVATFPAVKVTRVGAARGPRPRPL